MLEKKEVEFIISPDGNVEFTVKGAKGGQCVPIADLFKVLGKVTSEETTAEFYDKEDDNTVTISQSK